MSVNRYMLTRISILFLCLLLAGLQDGVGSLVSAGAKGAREIAEAIAEQAGRKGSRRFIDRTTRELTELSARYGDDALVAVDRHGVAALRVLKNAGDDAGAFLPRAINRYGTDAVRLAETTAGRQILREGNELAIRAVARHSDAVIPVIRETGDVGARALNNVNAANGRRLAQMHRDRTFNAQDFEGLLEVIGRYGDSACDWIWRNKKALLLVGGAAAFVSNPKPYIDGTADLAKDVAGQVVSGVLGVVKDIIVEKVNVNLWIGIVLSLFGGYWFFKRRRAPVKADVEEQVESVE